MTMGRRVEVNTNEYYSASGASGRTGISYNLFGAMQSNRRQARNRMPDIGAVAARLKC
jgi:hypothetical protein